MDVLKMCSFLICMGIGQIADCQYTYFNNVYYGSTGNALMTTSFNHSEGYISLGQTSGIFEYRIVNFDGLTLTNDHLTLDYHNVIAGGSFSDGFFKSPNGYISQYDDFIAGCSYSTSVLGVIHLDENLNEIWSQYFEDWSICDTLSYSCSGFCEVDDSSFATLSGLFYHNGQPFHPDSSGWRITRMKYSTGEVLEDHQVIQPHYIYSLKQIRYVAGNYFILGYMVPYQGTSTNPTDEQILLYKVSPQGEILGQLDFGNPEYCYEQGAQMEITNNGQIALFYSRCDEMFDDVPFPGYIQKNKNHLVWIDPENLNVIADSLFELPGDEWRGGIGHLCTLIDDQDNILNLCFYRTFPGEVPSANNPYYPGNYITKFNSLGEIIWQESYASDDFGAPYYSNTSLLDLIQTPDGGYLGTGVSYNDFEQKHWLLKLDYCGYEEPMGCPAVVDVVEQNMAEEEILLWPNPCNNILKARLPNSVREVRLMDQTGRVVMQEKVYFPNQEWNVGAIGRGIYLLETIHDNGMVTSKRIVKG